jgi:ATP-dependent Clp protease ATP-binding subunit ClpB
MTSNIGSAQIQDLTARGAEQWEIDAAVKDLLKQQFRPEFLNRIDETIVFHPLSKDQLTRIVDVQLAALTHRLARRNLKLHVDPDAKRLLAEEGYDPTYGARPLKRVIQQRLENPLAKHLLRGDFPENATIHIATDPAKHDFTFTQGSEPVEGELVA